MQRRREIEVFSLSFLDLLSCGLGSMMLLFVLAAMLVERQGIHKQEAAKRGRVAEREHAAELLLAIGKQDEALENAKKRFHDEQQAQAGLDVDSAQSLVSDLQDADDWLRAHLEPEPAAKSRGPGPLIPKDPALLFLIDSSGSMLGCTQAEVLALRGSGQKGSKWPRVLAFVKQVLVSNPTSRFRIYTFSEGLTDLSRGWKQASEEEIARALDGIGTVNLRGGSNLGNALREIAPVILSEPSVRIYLVTDALPNLSEGLRDRSSRSVRASDRRDNLILARQVAEVKIGRGRGRWVVVLLPWEDDPDAAERYWQDFLPTFPGAVVVLPARWP